MKRSLIRLMISVGVLLLAFAIPFSGALAAEKNSLTGSNKAFEAEADLTQNFAGLSEYPALRESIPASPEATTQTQQQVQDFDCAAVTDIPVVECEALVALYNSTNGGQWEYRLNWLVSTTAGDWYGVTVADGHVTKLRLFMNNLNGVMPTELGNLIFLEELQLSNNLISGVIPASLGNLTYLKGLFLNENQLSGVIPLELGKLSSLQHLYLFDNQLSGPLPPELGNLSSLLNLFLSGNQLSGPIPAEFGGMTNLMVLHLENNQLSGTIPPEFGYLQSLDEAYLNNNQLSGTIPSGIGNLTNMSQLDLSKNQLSGSIPSELGNMDNLFSLSLSNNQLSGSIPSSLDSLPRLNQLYLDQNQLEGAIPPELGDLSSLAYLDLSYNRLTGTIPSSLGNLTDLFVMRLGSNRLSGAIPSGLVSLPKLLQLMLSSNQLSGTIPPEIGNLITLRQLELQNNQLSGVIPAEIGSLVNLVHLDLSNNMFSGEVPSSFTNLVKLCRMGDPNAPCYGRYMTDLGYNRLTVPAPEPIDDFLAEKDPDWYLTQAVTAEIPANTGGTVTSNDGMTVIEVPADAAGEGTLTILFVPKPFPRWGFGTLNFAGNSFDLIASIDGNPVLRFDAPLTLTLHYDESLLGLIPESTLLLYTWDAENMTWVDAASACPGGSQTHNPDENWLSLPICVPGEFALLGDAYDLFMPVIWR